MDATFVQALLVGLFVSFCLIGQLIGIYTNRAIFLSFGVGLILGDVQTGLLMGATAELAFMGFGVGAGGTVPPNPIGPGVVGTIMAIALKDTGMDVPTALSLSFPFAVMIQFVITFIYSLNAGSLSWATKSIQEGNYKSFKLTSNLTFIGFGVFGFIIGLVATMSIEVLRAFVNIIPQALISGLSVAGGLLPAIGFAMILNVMVKKEFIPAILLGYVCISYLAMPVIGLAFAGAILALNNFYNKGNGQADEQEEVIEDGI
ncbi:MULTISPECIES: PTS sugar transporter subunit IIC [Vagococcus]|uniref:PTS N-acetylgalactosamine transporter subunit IIC n=1 Tax=Vagococcus martis TaxID=1768210 RepID=A0A1V4DGI7_9ENTE|nr:MULTISPECIES: PTS sugar transporter subunit IIC [Vagococcus]MCI0130998.1 PTS sugar transporter subunit IIC [Vagococcus sp. CY53-2]OPF87605.1 PTS N-acetylgalactosamine transporter subunit IIC [Vagococcus martis]RHH67808.1 PTS sugar transporter subunit IIC [Vagococcus sp. AM17-17]